MNVRRDEHGYLPSRYNLRYGRYEYEVAPGRWVSRQRVHQLGLSNRVKGRPRNRKVKQVKAGRERLQGTRQGCTWLPLAEGVVPKCRPERWFAEAWVAEFAHCPYCGKQMRRAA